MPEFDEVLDDFGSNFKANMKKPWFKVALGAVVVVGLYVLYKSLKGDAGTGSNVAGGEYYVPTGYATGYPEYEGAMYGDGSGAGYLDSELESLYAQLDKMQTSQDTSNSALVEQVESLNVQVKTQQETNALLEAEIYKQNVISEMKANSELYNALQGSGYADDKEYLHKRNMELAESIGATFDGVTGNYYTEGGSVLYTTTAQTVGKTTSSGYVPKGSSNPAKLVVTENAKTPVSVSSYTSDQIALQQAGDAFNRAQAVGDSAGMAKAHADAEAIRAKYGYSGGADGSSIISTPNASSPSLVSGAGTSTADTETKKKTS